MNRPNINAQSDWQSFRLEPSQPTRLSTRPRRLLTLFFAAFATFGLGVSAPSFEIVDISPLSSGDAVAVSWESDFMDTSELLISTDLQNFSLLDTIIAGHGTTIAHVPMSAFHRSPHGFIRVRTIPGPVTAEVYPCHFTRSYNWNYGGDGVGVVEGLLRFPSQTCDSNDGPPNGRPVVIFMHGNGMDISSHSYLMAHLARNGFVTASISNGGSNEDRARAAISYLNSIHAFWNWRDRLSDDVVFAGHSRGGEAALTAARLLSQQPGLAHVPYAVKGVVSIAPTDGGGAGGNDPKEHLDGAMTRSFLAIYGSRDGDVIGEDLNLTAPEQTPFAIYDRTGSESSVEGILLPVEGVTKSMVYVHGANHRGFRDDLAGFEDRPWQRDIARGYINAFLRWQVFGESTFRKYFDGTAMPTSTEHDVFLQFSDIPRRVVDNFGQGGWSVNTRGGAVTKGPGISDTTEADLWQLNSSAPHDTQGLRIRWSDDPVNAWVRWDIPNSNVFGVGSARDVSRYDVLSLRVAQNYMSGLNTENEDQDFLIGLVTSAGALPSVVRVSEYGRIPYPDPFVVSMDDIFIDGNFVDAGDYTKTSLSTIRIPLEEFRGANLTDVRQIVMIFAVDGHETGSIIVDNLEFSR
ncbi:MAG TPA: hypothetical protein VJS65_09765 [Verrucomicrobiae bacterium]|nr:hypothetical protein [Verrucomicrobiae bacterium]